MNSSNNNEQTNSQGLATAALVLGILSIVTSLAWIIAIPLGILAIIFGAVSIKRTRGKALAGLITGIVGITMSILVFLMVYVALPALQSGQRDTARKNDASIISTEVLSYTTSNQGVLPSAQVLDSSQLSVITSIVETGTATEESAVYKAGTSCDGVESPRAYAVTILLEDGSEYCQGS